MIYNGTLLIYLRKNTDSPETRISRVAAALRKIAVPWGFGRNSLECAHMAALPALNLDKATGVITPDKTYPRHIFTIYGPQGEQGTEAQVVELFEDIGKALAPLNAGYQVLDWRDTVFGSPAVFKGDQPAVVPKRFRVTLTTMAYMSGALDVVANDEDDAKAKALEKTGDVSWSYEGVAEQPGQGPEVQSVEPR